MKIDTFENFWHHKRVLITGHTGFKGSWLSIWLHELGAEVIGYALPPATSRDNFVLSGIGSRIIDLRGDVRDVRAITQVFRQYQPEIVFHLAAQPLVRLSYAEPTATWETNVMGSLHVLEAFRECASAKVAVFITTDKCYENNGQKAGYRETDRMGGYDPYSSSKGACELAISSWRRSFLSPDNYGQHGKSVASARAGNVIGGGDWAQDRIIPDCIRSLEAGKAIGIRNPQAIRPWQHVLEPLNGYLRLAHSMWNDPVHYAEGWNFGPDPDSHATVREIATQVVEKYGSGMLEDLSSAEALHEARLLTLDITKAKCRLGWKPRLNLCDTIGLTVDWYKRYTRENVYQLDVEQIQKFISC